MPWLSCILSNIVLASIVALVAWIVQRRLQQPAIARVLWVLAIVKLATPPLVEVTLLEFPGSMACTLGVCGSAQHAGALTIAADVLPWALAAAWLVGAVATGAIAWRRWVQFQRLTAEAAPAPPLWQSLAARLSEELSLRRPPTVLIAHGQFPPLVTPGWRRPRLLLPQALADQLNASQRKALLLHELTHLKRGDQWIRILELAVRVAFWWLPLVGTIGRHLRACEEACCDAAVVARLPRGRHDYARLLLDVVDFTDPLPPQAAPQVTALSAADDLEQRLHAILDGAAERSWTWPTTALAMGLACVFLPCGLRYDFAGREIASEPASAAILDGCEPAAGATASPSCGGEVELARFCCPSFP